MRTDPIRIRHKRIVRLVYILCILALFLSVFAAAAEPVRAAETETADEELTLDSFAHSTIGIVTGATQADMAAEMFPEAEIKYFAGLPDIIAALDAGQIDCTIIPYFSAIVYMKDNPNLKVLPDELYPCDMGLAFQKSEASDELREQINEYIAQVEADGTMEALEENWLTTDGAAEPMIEKEDLGPGEHRKLTVATSGTFVPFSFVSNGDPEGFDIDFTTGFCNAYGYDFEFKVMDFNSILMAVSTGQCDFACSHLSITEERKESVNFSDPYAVSYNKLMYKEAQTGGNSLIDSFNKTFVRENRWLLILTGLGVTVLITALSAVFGTVLAALICLLRRKGNKVGNSIANVYVRIFQGTPVLVILLIFYYIVFAKTGLLDIFVAVVVFSLNSAAFFSESIMSGINAVPATQMEAALALGFTEKKAFWTFILPQAARHFLPVYRGEIISLLKGTSIVGYIAILDLTKASDLIRSSTFEAVFPLLVTAVIYFLLSWLLYSLLHKIEKKMNPVHGGHYLKNVVLREKQEGSKDEEGGAKA